MTNGGSNKNEISEKRTVHRRLGEFDVGKLNAPMII